METNKLKLNEDDFYSSPRGKNLRPDLVIQGISTEGYSIGDLQSYYVDTVCLIEVGGVYKPCLVRDISTVNTDTGDTCIEFIVRVPNKPSNKLITKRVQVSDVYKFSFKPSYIITAQGLAYLSYGIGKSYKKALVSRGLNVRGVNFSVSLEFLYLMEDYLYPRDPVFKQDGGKRDVCCVISNNTALLNGKIYVGRTYTAGEYSLTDTSFKVSKEIPCIHQRVSEYLSALSTSFTN